MGTDSYLLVLNAAEGFLQLAIGETPEHLRNPVHAVAHSVPKNIPDSVPGDLSASVPGDLSANVLGDVSVSGPGKVSGNISGDAPDSMPPIASYQNTFCGGSTPKKQDRSGHQGNSAVFSATTNKKKRGSSSLVRCAQEWRLPSQGTELLAPALKDLARRLRIDITQISHIACVTGPGSFTGIRLTTTSAGGLSMATGALMGGIPFLPLLACNARNLLQAVLPTSTTVWAITHARRDLVHAQAFRLESEGQGGVFAQSEILVLSLDELVALLSVGQGASEQEIKQHSTKQPNTEQLDDNSQCDSQQDANERVACKRVASERTTRGRVTNSQTANFQDASRQDNNRQTVHQQNSVILLGSGITRNKQYLQKRLGELSCPPVMLPETFDVPQAAILFEFASHVQYSPDELMPEYVRGSDAEEALESIATKLGLDAAEAQAAYQTLQNS